MALKTRRII